MTATAYLGELEVRPENYGVVEQLVQHSKRNPDKRAITFVKDKSRNDALFEEKFVTYADLLSSAVSIASYLQRQCNLQLGDRVLLVFNPSLEFYKAIMACFVGGFVPVPVAPPQPGMLEAQLATLSKIAETSGSKLILSNSTYQKVHTMDTSLLGRVVMGRITRQAEWPKLPWHIVEDIEKKADAATANLPSISPDTGSSSWAEASRLVLLQYTSGSTGFPKGIMVGYESLLYQVAADIQSLKLGEDTVFCSWLPHYHDFGLIVAFLCTITAGGHLVQVCPLDFIKRPGCWLDMITHYGGTHTASPDFGYSLVTRKASVKEKERFRLHSLRIAMSGAEPVQHTTMQAFFAAFEPCGFQREMFSVFYGLAEHVAGVTREGGAPLWVDREQLDAQGTAVVLEPAAAVGTNARVLMSCGLPGTASSAVATMKIVNPDTLEEQLDCRVGEVWINSLSKAMGYYGLPELTQEMFQARIEGDESGKEFLRTGDLGFMHLGHLYICGRLKDMIILNGHNIYANDMEDVVRQAHPAVRRGGVAVFAIDVWDEVANRNREAVVVLMEIEKLQHKTATPALLKEMVAAVRDSIMRAFWIQLHAIAVLVPGNVAKTSSGKVSRAACKKAYLAGKYAARQPCVMLFDDTKQADSQVGGERPDSQQASPASPEPTNKLCVGA